ncbi:MAG: SPFH domain-containing protein, partial [Planctomyces sp.]
KWGTPNPVMMRDPEFGPIRIRAFGTYALRAVDPRALLKELVGTDSSFDADAVSELLRSMIVTTFSELLSQAEIPALDMAKKYTEIAQKLRQAVQEKIDDEYGLELSQLVIVNISLPEAVEKALDTRTSMGVVGDLNRFQQYQLGQALGAPGGGGGAAAEGAGLGLGLALAGRMLQPGAGPASAVPAPPPLGTSWHLAVNGQSQGPYAHDQLIAAIAAGQISPATLVWTSGMAAWSPASQVPQLATAFGPPLPPPLPPQP